MNTASWSRIPRILIALLAISAFLLGNRSASADTVTSSTTYALAYTDFTDVIALPMFDPSLGTLTSVQITVDGVLQSEFVVQNTSHVAQTIVGNSSAAITLTRPDGSTLAVATPQDNMSAPLAAFQGMYYIDFNTGDPNLFFSLASPDYFDSGLQISPQSASSDLLTGVDDLALFTGVLPTDTISLPFNAVGNGMLAANGNLLGSISTQAGATITVVYTYTP